MKFFDKKYGFECNHDIQHDFETEYEQIYQKYMRRVERFRRGIKQPTCFIRAVRSEKEVSYIEKNNSYIYDVIKKENDNNEIIFFAFKYLRANGLEPSGFLVSKADGENERVEGVLVEEFASIRDISDIGIIISVGVHSAGEVEQILRSKSIENYIRYLG